MSLYTIQDTEEDPLKYISSVTTIQAANDLLQELYRQDEEEGCLDRMRYKVKRRAHCFADISATCGWNTNCVCMSDDMDNECPAKKRSMK